MFAAAISAPPLSIAVALGTLGLLAAPWFVRLPRLALGLLFITLLTGQAVRLPVAGQGGGLLPSDIAVVLVLVSAMVRIRLNPPGKKPLLTTYYLLLTTPLILWSAFSLALNAAELGPGNTAVALAYWVRLVVHLLLLPALIVLFRDARTADFARRGLIITVALLTAAGFLQLQVLPDLTPFSRYGWDPHQGRLVSTWLDPNFFGIFLAMLLPFVLSLAAGGRLAPRYYGRKIWLYCLALAVFLALILTQSRSSLVALSAALLIVSPLVIARLLHPPTGRGRPRTPRLVFVSSVLVLIMLGVSAAGFAIGPRLSGLVRPDATVMLRLEALQADWQLAAANSIFGVGYNAYQFAAERAGLISDFTIHSRAGADNSFLTIWVTTGLVGLLLLALPWAALAQTLARRWVWYADKAAMAALVGIIALTVHSQFVNSLLYAHVLITVSLLVAVALSPTRA